MCLTVFYHTSSAWLRSVATPQSATVIHPDCLPFSPASPRHSRLVSPCAPNLGQCPLGTNPSFLGGGRYTSPHLRLLVRELRVLVYTQFLESYRSVRLASMAASFGVSIDFLDT